MMTDLYNKTLQSLNKGDIVKSKFYELISDFMSKSFEDNNVTISMN